MNGSEGPLAALIFTVGIPAAFVLAVWILAGLLERGHLRGLARREAETAHMLVTDIRAYAPDADPDKAAAMVTVGVVLGIDYVKNVLASIRKIFGGEMGSYQKVADRARREAVVRLLERARAAGYNAVCNLRLDTADMGGGSMAKGIPMVVLFATGTAYRRSSGA